MHRAAGDLKLHSIFCVVRTKRCMQSKKCPQTIVDPFQPEGEGHMRWLLKSSDKTRRTGKYQIAGTCCIGCANGTLLKINNVPVPKFILKRGLPHPSRCLQRMGHNSINIASSLNPPHSARSSESAPESSADTWCCNAAANTHSAASDRHSSSARRAAHRSLRRRMPDSLSS